MRRRHDPTAPPKLAQSTCHLHQDTRDLNCGSRIHHAIRFFGLTTRCATTAFAQLEQCPCHAVLRQQRAPNCMMPTREQTRPWHSEESKVYCDESSCVCVGRFQWTPSYQVTRAGSLTHERCRAGRAARGSGGRAECPRLAKYPATSRQCFAGQRRRQGHAAPAGPHPERATSLQSPCCANSKRARNFATPAPSKNSGRGKRRRKTTSSTVAQ